MTPVRVKTVQVRMNGNKLAAAAPATLAPMSTSTIPATATAEAQRPAARAVETPRAISINTPFPRADPDRGVA